MNRVEFFEELNNNSMLRLEDMQKIQAAYWLSKEAHRRQFRDGGERYFEHPRSVALLAHQFGYKDFVSICIALLHDALEDSFTPMVVYLHLFGVVVWAGIETLSKKIPHHDPITGEVTNFSKKQLDEYFAKLYCAPKNVRAIKCCDRLHNLRTLGSRSAEKKREQIDETRQYILPLADMTDPEIAKALRAEIANIEAELSALTPIA